MEGAWHRRSRAPSLFRRLAVDGDVTYRRWVLDTLIALLAAVGASGFAIDLGRNWLRRRRPHVAAYAVGIIMFAVATWALVHGLAFGWTGAAYRTFFIFGAILNIPYLALGSMFLVGGKRAGHIMLLFLGGLSAIAITLTTTVDFARPLPTGGVPHDIFPPITAGFGPRLLAAIGGGLGASILILLALISLIRFWRTNRRLVAGNMLIVAGTFAASTGGTGLALGEGGAFAISLLAAAALIWAGYRVASGARMSSPASR